MSHGREEVLYDLIIYIAGYGHSGSTILDMMISSNESGIVGLGEIGNIGRDMIKYKGSTTDMESSKSYQFIKEVLSSQNLSIEDFHNLRKLEGMRKLWVSEEDKLNHMKAWKSFYDGMLRKGSWLHAVDSTKTAWYSFRRPKLLNEAYDGEVYIIHLSRSYGSMLDSRMTAAIKYSKLSLLLKLPMTFVGKFFSDVMTTQYKNQGYHYLKINFDSLMNQPEDVLKQVEYFLNMDLSVSIDKVKKGKPLDKGLRLSGNAMRKQNRVVFKKPNGL